MTFPLDWDDWIQEFDRWAFEHITDLRPTSYQFPEKNFMADRIIGKWSINGRNVELSEVTFPDLRRDPMTGRLPAGGWRRFIGITFGTATGTDVPDNPIVESFEELEQELGI